MGRRLGGVLATCAMLAGVAHAQSNTRSDTITYNQHQADDDYRMRILVGAVNQCADGVVRLLLRSGDRSRSHIAHAAAKRCSYPYVSNHFLTQEQADTAVEMEAYKEIDRALRGE